jgi:hypothetical protein
MSTTLSFTDFAPLNSVMICWNIVATTVIMSLRDVLFALGVWTDWLRTCWLCLKGKGGCRSVQLRAAEAAAVAVFCCVAPPQMIALGRRGWQNPLAVVV